MAEEMADSRSAGVCWRFVAAELKGCGKDTAWRVCCCNLASDSLWGHIKRSQEEVLESISLNLSALRIHLHH